MDAGALGERAAERRLRREGFRILDRNWRSGHLELDLVTREGGVIAFVEVKTRRPGPGRPADAVGREKRRRITRAASAWIAAHPGIGHEFRFDVVEVWLAPGGPPLIEHHRGAFEADGS
jgi:putative endonuclease